MARSDPAPCLSIVIVNHESGDHLRRCLSALAAAAGDCSREVIVVDNASTHDNLDDLEKGHGSPRLIINHSNRGYGRACNQGAAAASADLLCFLNPDTIPAEQSLQTLAARLKDLPAAGAMGPAIFNPDGSLYPSCRVIPSLGVALGHAAFGLIRPDNPFTRRYQLTDWDHESSREVDWISGAAMMVRSEAFANAGGFDEGFFMYAEDVDLCDRLRRAGWKIFYEPAARMVHHSAGSTQRAPYRMIRHHHFSLIRYAYNKTKRSPQILALPFVAAALLGRMAMAWVKKALTR